MPWGDIQQSRSRVPQADLDDRHRWGRPRVVAALVLLAVIVVMVVTGLAVSRDGTSSGAGEAIPFNLLPFPQDTVPTTTQ